MRKNLFLAFLLIATTSLALKGQFSGTWTPTQNLKNSSRPDKVLISSQSDYENLLKRPVVLFDAYSVKIDNYPLNTELIQLLNKWQDVTELYLHNSYKDLKETDFAQLTHIEHLIVEVEADDSAYLDLFYTIPYLEKITFIFKEEQENWDFLFFYRNLKNVHIYGTFLPEVFHEMVDKLMYFNNLSELGVSIDYATDLPRNLNLLTQLQTLKLYDNLTRLNYNHLGFVQSEKFNISGVMGNDQPTSVSVLFYAEDFGLTIRESKYLESIWSGKREAYSPSSESITANKGIKDLYVLAPKPVFSLISNIETLLADLYPTAEIFEINTENNNVIHTKSGCNIFLPQSCFLKPDGSVFEGKAFVSIRYMQDVLDVAFRGLDLKVTKYPGSPLYNSDVMIEIEVSDGVFPLQFNNSMNIRMDVPTNDTASTFYYFDPESQGFLDYELYKSIFTNTDVSQIPIRYDEWLRNNTAKHNYTLDSRSFTDRFRNPENFFLFDENIKSEKFIKEGKFFTNMEYAWEKSVPSKKGSSFQLRLGKTMLKISKKSPKNKTKDDLFFQVQEKNSFFNELGVLKKVLFKLADTLSSKEFSAAYSRNKKYSDFRIVEDKPNGKWNLIMKSDEGYLVVKVEPRFYKLNGKPISDSKSKSRLQKFVKTQTQRETSFNNFIQKRENDYVKYYQKRQSDWEKKQKFKTVFIKSTGVYGFMNISEPKEDNLNCFINFLDYNGLPLDIKHLFMVNKSTRSVQRISQGNLSLDMATISFILCRDYKGQLHYIDGESLRTLNLKDGSIYFMRLNSVPHPPRSVEEFKKYTKYEKVK